MYYIRLLKKYGITAAAAFMVAVMLCTTPLMAMADDVPAAVYSKGESSSFKKADTLKDEFSSSSDSGKKISTKKAANVKLDDTKSKETESAKESSEDKSASEDQTDNSDKKVNSSGAEDTETDKKDTDTTDKKEDKKEKTSADKEDNTDKENEDNKKDESTKTEGDSSEASGKETDQGEKSDSDKDIVSGSQSPETTQQEVKETEPADGSKQQPEKTTADEEKKETAPAAGDTASEGKEDTAEESGKSNDTEKDSDSGDSDNKEVKETEPSVQTESEADAKDTGEETEKDIEKDIDLLQITRNKGKNKKNTNPDSKESRKGSEKVEKEAGEKATKKKKEKQTASEQTKAERDFEHHASGVAPWKGHSVNLPDLVVKQELRFKTVKDADSKAAAKKIYVYEKMKKSSKKVGYVIAGGEVSVLAQDGDWDYIECGELRGFVKDSSLSDIDELEKIRKRIVNKAVGKEKNKTKTRLIKAKKEKEFKDPAVLLVETVDNEAFTYKKLTAQNTVVKKVYALVDTAAAFEKMQTADLNGPLQLKSQVKTEGKKNIKIAQAESVEIKEEKSAKSRTIGTIKNGGLLYIITDADEKWAYVESGDVRGFIESVYLSTGKAVNKKVKKKGERKFPTARKKVDPAENKAFYYTIYTTVDKTAEQEFRETIIKAAAQCIGNPYVWGGTSLVNGADCSGFVQTLYRNYGISLPRVADDQSEVGTKVTLESAEAGDLIFFADSSGYVYHVAISTGDGGTIEARNERFGIVRVKDRSGASWATDIISDMFQD